MTKYKLNGRHSFQTHVFFKNFIFCLVSLVCSIDSILAQSPPDPIRLVFNQYATKEGNREWSEWKNGQNIFVVFFNDNGDLMHYKSGGGQELYVKRTNWQDGVGKNGAEYIYGDFILENGTVATVQVYTKPSVFIKVILGEGALIVQFDNL